MSMSPDQEDFQDLRQLLTLKRHEQPPPGYFSRFSSQVIARIQAGEGAEAGFIAQRFGWEANWFQQWWSGLEAKPVFAGALGLAICGLLISGIVYSDRGEPIPAAVLVSSPRATEQPVQMADGLANPLMNRPTEADLSSMGGVGSGQLPSLFKDLQRPQPQLVGFPAGN